MLRQFRDDQLTLQEPVALGMGVAHRMAVAFEGLTVGARHDLEDFGGQSLAFVKMNVQFIRIAALGLTMIFASRVWPDR
ncbi:hypothetical protein SAMN05428950_1076 [Sphingomonas sp. OV641]|nr:hypothetical protein SAMN05428950_1076 [Sphingomonas sp. OV641]